MNNFLRFLWTFLKGLAAVLLLAVVLLVAAVAWLGFTTSGNRFAADQVAQLISTPDMQVSLKGASGLLQGKFRLDSVVLADTRGQFAKIDGIALDWVPSALLKMRFHATNISAANVALDRLPISTVEPKPSEGSFSLPVEIAVDHIDLPAILLAAAVAGRDTDVALAGSAKAVRDQISLDIEAKEKARPDSRAIAKLAYGVNARTLTLDGLLAEPGDGIIARLLRLPGLPSLEIAVKGDGSLDDWKGNINGRVNGVETLNLRGSHTRSQSGLHSVLLNGGGQLAELLPPSLRPLFAGQTDVDVDAQFSESGLLEVRSGTIANDSLLLDASGKIDPKGEATLQARLGSPSDVIDILLPMGADQLHAQISSATLSVTGPFHSTQIDFNAIIPSLQTAKAGVRSLSLSAAAPKFNLADRAGALSLSLSAGETRFDNEQAAKIVQGPLAIRGDVSLAPEKIVAEKVTIESPRLGGTISGAFTPASQDLTSDFNIFLLPEGVLPPDLAAKIEGTLGLSGHASASLPGAFALEGLTLKSNLVTASGSATYDEGAITAALKGIVADLGALQPGISGKAEFAADLSGNATAPALTAQLTIPEARLADRILKALTLKVQGILDPKQPNGKLAATGTLEDQVIDLTAEAQAINGAVSIPALNVKVGQNTLAGAMTLDASLMPSGKIDFDFPDLGLLAALGNQKAEGAIKGTATIASADGKMTGAVKANGSRIVSSGAEIVNPVIDLTIADLAKVQLSGLVSADRIVSGTNRLDAVALDFIQRGLLTEFGLKSQFDGAPMTADGTVEPKDSGITITLASFSATPKKIPVRLAQPSMIRIAGGTAVIESLVIGTGDGSVSVKGSAGKQLDLSAQISALPLSLANAFSEGLDAEGKLSGDITVIGESSAPVVAFRANAQGVSTAQMRDAKVGALSIEATGELANEALKLDATGTIGKQPVKAALQASLAKGTFALPFLKLDVGPNTISGQIKLDETFQPSGKVDFDLPDVAMLAAIAGKQAEGAVKGTTLISSNAGKIVAEIDASGEFRGQPLTASLTVNSEKGAVSLPAFKLDVDQNKLSGAITLDAAFKPNGKVKFDLPDIGQLAALAGQKAEGSLKGTADITSAGNKITAAVIATGDIRGNPIDIDVDATTENGAVAIPALKLGIGPNNLTGAITLNETFLPTGKVDFDFPDVSLLAAIAGQKAEGSLKGKADITSAGSKITGAINADGAIRGQTIGIDLNATSEGGAISLPVIKLDVGSNTVAGAMTLDKSFLPSGKIEFDLPDIALLAAMGGQKAQGAIKGAAEIKSADGKITGTIKANGTKLTSNGAEIVKPVIDLAIGDLATGQISGTVGADRVASGANELRRLAMTFTRQGNQTAFDLGGQYDSAPLVVKGAVQQKADSAIALKLTAFSATPKKIPVKLNAPVDIAIKDSTVTFPAFALAIGRGTVQVSGSAGKALDIKAKISALPAALANSFASGLGASGMISANIAVAGNSSNPAVTFDTNWQDAALAQTRSAGLKNFAISAKGKLANNVLSIDTTARNGDGMSLNAKGTVGTTGSMPLSIAVKGQLPFTALAVQLAQQGIALKGTGNIDITVKGAATKPVASGKITTNGTTLTVIRQNLTLKNIAAAINLEGDRARIASLTGAFEGGGSVAVDGTIGFAPGSGLPVDIKVALKNAVYTDGRVVAAKLGGDMSIKGKLQQSPVLAGNIKLSRVDITIPERLPGSLSKVDVKHKNAPKAVVNQVKEVRQEPSSGNKGGGPAGIMLDLKINAPGQIFVRGRGLDTELGGEISISGNSSKPNVTGGFTMRRGRLAIIGKRLDFTSGTITFAGGLMPSLNMVASTTVQSTTVSVTVSGPANSPSFAFTSSPALPQDEVLARLIFGRSSTSLSPIQIAQLADAVATLAGGQSNSLFNKLRQGLGVDDLDVGTDENGKTNVSAGKYLNKRTYLELKQGSDSNSSKAAINLDIGKGVKLRTEAGADGSTATGIFYEKEY
ncbi:translocation/assembly module TamB domain-containing protein [Rhizobium sp. KVB221]|uniref:Translocation/assembly module TamB domain-containing protein n=1 Tax=Rhizobium setariae TaxID=2801340 RepID=A0A936YW71_9HYPH|nr:translocation/assembly module TamB domain-containing protein [Rhizobium setariae]MBL0374817.1 translocation/assembly module TamB domain-containing protein [Rhizobium setariae]